MKPVNLYNFIIRTVNSINIPLQGFSLYRDVRVSTLVSADTSIHVILFAHPAHSCRSSRFVADFKAIISYHEPLLFGNGTPAGRIQRPLFNGAIFIEFSDRGPYGVRASGARMALFREVKNKHREETRSIPRPFLSIRPLRSVLPPRRPSTPHPAVLCLSSERIPGLGPRSRGSPLNSKRRSVAPESRYRGGRAHSRNQKRRRVKPPSKIVSNR